MNKNRRIFRLILFLLPVTTFAQSTDKASLDSIEIEPNPYDARVNNKKLYPGYIDIKNIPAPKAEVIIYSLGGGEIRKLVKKEGEHNVLWFLRSEKNEPIETGIYLISIKVEGMDKRIMTFYYTSKDDTDYK